MILGVCEDLEKTTGIPAVLFRILFVIWFINSAWAFIIYILFAAIM